MTWVHRAIPLASVLVTLPAGAQELLFRDRVRGELIVVGNTLGLSGDDGILGYADRPGTVDSAFTFLADVEPPTRDNAAWGDFTTNDWARSLSRTRLNLPSGGAVVRAALVWTGSCARSEGPLGDAEDVSGDIGAPVVLRVGEIDYTIAPDGVVDRCATDTSGYVAWADVTTVPLASGWVGVGGVPGTQVQVDDNWAGWTLFVAVDTNTEPRLLSAWVHWLEAGGPTANPTQVDAVCWPDRDDEAVAWFTLAEGDADRTGDALWLGGDAAWAAGPEPVAGPRNPAANFAASQLVDTAGDPMVAGRFRVPGDHRPFGSSLCSANDSSCLAVGGRQGLDVVGLVLESDDRVAPGESSLTFLPIAGGDAHVLVASAFDAPLPSADLVSTGLSTPSTTWIATDGGDAELVVTLRNAGDAPAEHVRLAWDLPDSIVDVPLFGWELDGTPSGRPVTVAELTAGTPIPDVPPGSELLVRATVTIGQTDPARFAVTPSWTWSWSECHSEATGSATGASRHIDVDWCGDGVRNGPEACDSADLDGQTCEDFGLIGPGPTCTDTCTLDTSTCCPDGDGDGVCDADDICDGDDTVDTDGDTVPDDCDRCPLDRPDDRDVDGICDSEDPCFGDNATGDSDADGVCDSDDACLGDDATGDPDGDHLCADTEAGLGTRPDDDDSDDDGLMDDAEAAIGTDPLRADTDGDGVQDGTELGLAQPQGDDTDLARFVPDADLGATTTDPLRADSDGGGTPDGVEDSNRDGALDALECDPTDGSDDAGCTDADGDGLSDLAEADAGTSSDDDDTDDDGILDGSELAEGTDPTRPDTDGDGLTDGQERGLTAPQGNDTNLDLFVPDADPSTTTDPTRRDTDGGGAEDGVEDIDLDGRQDDGECNPRVPDDDLQCLDSDGDGLSDAAERETGLDRFDADSDDDGLTDGEEVAGTTSPNLADTDGDGIQDGTELGLAAATHDDTDATRFVPDADPSTTTDPNNGDTDGGGTPDGVEDADRNGRLDDGECDPRDDSDDDECVDTDGDGLSDAAEAALNTDAQDDDTDDDGVRDGREPALGLDPRNPDTDGDGLTDGQELGLVAPEGRHTDPDTFVADADPETTTDPTRADTDNGGVPDGVEDADRDGAIDDGDCDPRDPDDDAFCIDTDNDGLSDGEEALVGTSPEDADSDDDGLSDGFEVRRGTDPNTPDTDRDGVQDGTELGVTAPLPDTDGDVFQPDADPSTTTDPILRDSDGGGLVDGDEDLDGDGAVDPGETDPTDGTDDSFDLDGDGVTNVDEVSDGTNPLDPDSDDDGLSDGDERGRGTDPLDPDSDDDGLNDGAEVGDHGTDPLDPDSDDDGLSDRAEIHDHGTNPLLADTDNDRLTDRAELQDHGTDPLIADTDGGSVDDGAEVAASTDPLDGRDDLPGRYGSAACGGCDTTSPRGAAAWLAVLALVALRRSR